MLRANDRRRFAILSTRMRYLSLIFANLQRHRLRTVFTLFSVAIAFLLFGLLAAVRNGFESGVELAGADRLITIHKISLIQPLPSSYLAQIAAVPGVKQVSHSTWFGSSYQSPRNVITTQPVDPRGFLALYPEMLLPDEQRERWFNDRSGAVVGRIYAERFGWKVGDRLPLHSDIYSKKDGSYDWEFTIDGIVDNRDPSGDTGLIMIHYDYFDEARAMGKGTVGWYIERIDKADDAARVAAAIDAQFANSSAETKTGTEKAFIQGFANQAGDIGAIMISIGLAVFFTMLLVSGNTMAQSVRERTREIAVLKTLGFGNLTVLTLVLAESVLITMLGGVIGLALSFAVVKKTAAMLSQFLSSFVMTNSMLITGVGLMIVLGLVAGAMPALRASRLQIADALRR
jgi:putative ABC transport system permease protein